MTAPGIFSPHFLVGSSSRIGEVQRLIDKSARNRLPVLLLGESGSGKEVVARAIHEANPRGQFVPIDCGSLVGTLMESELFGHVKGSFSGAVENKKGLVELADGGTAFFDEIGDLPLELQVKLLRLIQEREFRPVGALQWRKVDLRIIAATHRDLKGEVAAGRFRQDLFYRLQVVVVHLPPLREHKEDIPLLVDRFLELGQAAGLPRFRPGRELVAALANYDWPGNVRELQNVIERAVIMTEGSVLRLLPDELSQARIGEPAVRTLRDAQRVHIIAALRDANWVIGGPHGAAARLAVPRTTLIGTMKRLGISQPPRQDRNEHPNTMGSASNWFVPEIGNTPDCDTNAYANQTSGS